MKRLKELEKENERLRKAFAGSPDLTLEKLILRGAASGNFKLGRGTGRDRRRGAMGRRDGLEPLP